MSEIDIRNAVARATEPSEISLLPVGSSSLVAPKEAFYGLAGEITKAIEPHSEADPMGLLIQFLVAFGNASGRSAYFRAEADKHYTNLFSVLVGQSSKARKGTSWGYIRELFKQADPEWADTRAISGLSSGEGLIWAVRDEVEGDSDNTQAGVEDKRLLVIESEFASPLKSTRREGNTLSTAVRNAWDTGELRFLTKNSPACATSAHISIIGHITKDELRRDLTPMPFT